eukprot:31199-Pelagococcus_subviridis.AAC.1
MRVHITNLIHHGSASRRVESSVHISSRMDAISAKTSVFARSPSISLIFPSYLPTTASTFE